MKIFMRKTAKWRFGPPIGGIRGNLHTSFMPRRKACDRLPIGDNIAFFISFFITETLQAKISPSRFLVKGVGSF